MAGDHRQSAENFFKWQWHADNTGGADKQFLPGAAESLCGFGDGTLGGGMARCAGGAVRVPGVYHHRAHPAFRRAQMFLGNQHGGCNYQILREDGGSRRRHIA